MCVLAGRLRVSVSDAALIDAGALRALGLRGVALPVPGVAHILVGPAAGEAGAALEQVLK